MCMRAVNLTETDIQLSSNWGFFELRQFVDSFSSGLSPLSASSAGE